MDAVGDVYGGGSTNGKVFYENGALGRRPRGHLLAAKPGATRSSPTSRRRRRRAFALERHIFVTSNKNRSTHGSTSSGAAAASPALWPRYSARRTSRSARDGAIYVTDWIDARVGGHQDSGRLEAGQSNRIGPRARLEAAAFDALDHRRPDHGRCARRPSTSAPSVLRAEGARRRRGAGGGQVLDDPNRLSRGRAMYMRYQLGPKGRSGAGRARVAARRRDEIAPSAPCAGRARSLRRRRSWPRTRIPACRREAALSLRDQPAEKTTWRSSRRHRPRYDGQDRSYLEAFGPDRHEEGSGGLRPTAQGAGAPRDPLAWERKFAQLAGAARASGGARLADPGKATKLSAGHARSRWTRSHS